MFDRYEILKQHYAEEIQKWDWDELTKDAVREDAYEGAHRAYLGTVFAIMPSGKFYMPWTTNQTRADETRDAAFFEALEEAAERAGGWIENGDSDPCDLFFCVAADEEETDDA